MRITTTTDSVCLCEQFPSVLTSNKFKQFSAPFMFIATVSFPNTHWVSKFSVNTWQISQEPLCATLYMSTLPLHNVYDTLIFTNLHNHNAHARIAVLKEGVSVKELVSSWFVCHKKKLSLDLEQIVQKMSLQKSTHTERHTYTHRQWTYSPTFHSLTFDYIITEWKPRTSCVTLCWIEGCVSQDLRHLSLRFVSLAVSAVCYIWFHLRLCA